MATFKTELFGHMVYSPELSYEDLLAREEELKALLQAVLAENGAEHLHFEGLGDTLRVQCEFAGGDEAFYQNICTALSPALRNGISGRLLFVDRDLENLHFYAIRDSKWQEAVQTLPEPGFLDPVALPVKVLDMARSRSKNATKTGEKPSAKNAGREKNGKR